MIRRSAFHPRLEQLNATALWTHWAGCLVAPRYQLSEKFEYFALRNAAGLFDTSPLYKYRFTGPEVAEYLGGVLVRNPDRMRAGQAQYTAWCDDRGYVIEDGVLFRHGADDFMLTTAEPNLAYFTALATGTKVQIEDVSDHIAALAIQGPNSRAILAELLPEVSGLGFFHHVDAKLGDAPVTVSRTGFTGDLGYELWIPADDALEVFDAVCESGAPHGLIPVGLDALDMARIEAGLLLLDVDFDSARFAFNDAHRSTPTELGFGWMHRAIESEGRAFIGRDAIRRELEGGLTRWSQVGLIVDWAEHDRAYRSAGLLPPKDHRPVRGESMVYDESGERVGYTTSAMYSPVLQRHIALARVRPDLGTVGIGVQVEFTIDHAYEKIAATVTALPFYDPPRRTAMP